MATTTKQAPERRLAPAPGKDLLWEMTFRRARQREANKRNLDLAPSGLQDIARVPDEANTGMEEMARYAIAATQKAEKARRAAARRAQAARDHERLHQFKAKVWPKLAPVYGKGGWREEAHDLCAAAGIDLDGDNRALDRLLEKGREAGWVPPLRVSRRHS